MSYLPLNLWLLLPYSHSTMNMKGTKNHQNEKFLLPVLQNTKDVKEQNHREVT